MTNLQAILLRRGSVLQGSSGGDAAVETMALATAIACLDQLEGLPTTTRLAIAKSGRRVLMGLGASLGAAGPDDDHDDDGSIGMQLAWAGVSALEGAPVPTDGLPRDATHPSAARLVDLAAARLDGIAAAMAALHVRACAPCLAAWNVASRSPGSGARLQAAAAEAAPMRSPLEGTAILGPTIEGIELFAFADADGRRVAIYSAEALPVRLQAQGVATEHMLPGYWIGRVADGADDPIVGDLHIGDRQVRVEFTWPALPEAP